MSFKVQNDPGAFGAGQWLEAKHGAKSRRTWRKLHLAVDADNGMFVAHVLTVLTPPFRYLRPALPTLNV